MNFDLKNGCKNELDDNNVKSCSCSRNRVSHKIDFKAGLASRLSFKMIPGCSSVLNERV